VRPVPDRRVALVVTAVGGIAFVVLAVLLVVPAAETFPLPRTAGNVVAGRTGG